MGIFTYVVIHTYALKYRCYYYYSNMMRPIFWKMMHWKDELFAPQIPRTGVTPCPVGTQGAPLWLRRQKGQAKTLPLFLKAEIEAASRQTKDWLVWIISACSGGQGCPSSSALWLWRDWGQEGGGRRVGMAHVHVTGTPEVYWGDPDYL